MAFRLKPGWDNWAGFLALALEWSEHTGICANETRPNLRSYPTETYLREGEYALGPGEKDSELMAFLQGHEAVEMESLRPMSEGNAPRHG